MKLYILLHYVPSLLLLVGLLGFLSGGFLIARKLLNKSLARLLRSDLGTMTAVAIEKTISQGPKVIIALSCLYIGYTIGYAKRDIEQYNRLVTRHNLTVIHRSETDTSMYEFRNSVNEHTTLKFSGEHCKRIPNFNEGNQLEIIVYEDFGTCQSLDDNKTWYRVKQDKNQQPIITALKGEP